MTSFATTSKTIHLALALTVVTPVPLLAQTLTAREMLAQAQKQAVMPPAEIKTPGATEIAKLEVGKPDAARPQPTSIEPPRVELAPPMPIVAPAAPEPPASATIQPPALQNRVSGDSTPAMPAPDAAKPSPAPIAVQAAPPAAISAARVPAATASPAPTSPAAVLAPASQARAPQSTTAVPPARVADTTYMQAPDPAPAAIRANSRHEHPRAAGKAPRQEQASIRHPHGSGAAALNGVNVQMMSQIMRRPEVQSLLAQYGVR